MAAADADDMAHLPRLDEEAVLETLRARFLRQRIYTYVGTVLISVNPYEPLPIYTPAVLAQYQQRQPNLPPHVFAVADRVYRDLVSEWRHQAIVVSGESGAGKTEATKLVLEYLMEMSALATRALSSSASTTAASSLEDQCMHASTILEAFGNAKTLRNDNSSRFGKWIEVSFDRQGRVRGAAIRTYLLEKSRVVHPERGERNYHVFYQHLAAEGLSPLVEKSPYLSGAGVTRIDHVSDLEEHARLVEAYNAFAITPDERRDVGHLLEAVVHLGNVEFAPSRIQSDTDAADGSAYRDGTSVRTAEAAAGLLGCDAAALERALCFRTVAHARESFAVPHTPAQASDSRDALAKALYEGLFHWIVVKINAVLDELGTAPAASAAEEAAETRTIGALDIFGFEIMPVNSLNQLAINFCNETLHHHFSEECFRIEQAEYRAEGIDVAHVPFVDNQPCVALFAAKPKGIFLMIEEEIATPGGSDAKLNEKLAATHADHAHFSRARPKEGGASCFKVHHYAGDVVYAVTGMLELSRDKLAADLDKLANGASPFVAELMRLRRSRCGGGDGGVARHHSASSSFDDTAASPLAPAGRKRAQRSLGLQFSSQLEALMEKLRSTNAHFVKCLRSNADKQARVYDRSEMLHQLRYTGVLGLCQLRKLGFAIRTPFADFTGKYRALARVNGRGRGHMDVIDGLVRCGLVERMSNDLALGKSKVFLRHKLHKSLEDALAVLVAKAAHVLGRCAKHHIARKRARVYLLIHSVLRDGLMNRNAESLEIGLREMEVLPCAGRSFPQRDAALDLLVTLRKEAKVKEIVRRATASRDRASIEQALLTAEEAGLATCAEARSARAALSELEAARHVRANLNYLETLAGTLGVSMRTAKGPNLDVLRKLQALYTDINVEHVQSAGRFDEYEAVGMLIHKAEQMLDALEAVRHAAKGSDYAEIADAIEVARELGLENHADVQSATWQASEMERAHRRSRADSLSPDAEAVTPDHPEGRSSFGDAGSSAGSERSRRRRSSAGAGEPRVKPRSLSNPSEPIPQKEGPMDRILNIASSSRWRLMNYRKLRPPESYARSAWMNKRRLMEGMLTFSPDVIPMSLVDLNERENRAAVQLNKSLLAFTGVRKTTFPAACALDIIQRGVESVGLRDEIMVQCCKNVALNSNQAAVAKTWIILCFCASLFSPSVEFELYFLHFLIPFTHHRLWYPFAMYIMKDLEQQLDMDERELSDLLYNTPLPRVEDLVHATTDPRAWIDSRMRTRGWGDWLAAVPV